MYPLNILSIGLVFLTVYLIIQAIDHIAGPGRDVDFLPGGARARRGADEGALAPISA